MNLNLVSHPIVRLGSLLAALVVMVACGGGGGGGSSSSGGGSGGGSGTSLTVASDMRWVNGIAQTAHEISNTPQDVTLLVNSVETVVTDVVVADTIVVGEQIDILREGSRPLNISLPDPSAGLRIGTVSGLTVPVSSDGTLLGSVHSPNQALFSPPGTWNGIPLPTLDLLAGLSISAPESGGFQGEHRVVIQGTPRVSSGGLATGSSTITWSTTAPEVGGAVALADGNGSGISTIGVGTSTSSPIVVSSPTGSASGIWSVMGTAKPDGLTSALISVQVGENLAAGG